MTLDTDRPSTARCSTQLPPRAAAILRAEVEARRRRGKNQKNGAAQHDVIADALERAYGRKHRAAAAGG